MICLATHLSNSSSLKAVVKPQRLAVRKLYSQIHSEKIQGTRTLSVLIEYLESKKEELKHTCLSIVCSIRDIFLPMASTAETRVFFNKIAGDYSRYICEIPSDETIRRNELIDQTESFYVHAFEEAQSDLSPAHPERLSLVLNFSTFLREIKGDAERSMELAKDAFDDAAAELGIVAPKFDSVDSLPLSSSFDETFTIDADVSEQTNEFEEEDSKRILDIIRNTLKRLEMNL